MGFEKVVKLHSTFFPVVNKFFYAFSEIKKDAPKSILERMVFQMSILT